jgi:hypothetical protein
MSDTFEMEIVRTVTVTVLGYAPARPGRINADPDSCYPPEPEEFECEAHDADGRPVALTPEEIDDARRQYLDRIEADADNYDADAFDRENDR